jgi:branched-chain amino acid transport system permease protein
VRGSFTMGRKRWLVWGAYAALLLVAPLIFRTSLAMTMLSQIGIASSSPAWPTTCCWGRAACSASAMPCTTGLGSFFAIHTLNLVSKGALTLPVSLLPLVGGAGGLFAVLLGYVTTRKAGTPFAMITLGVGELVWAMSLMFPEFFGGEGGISGNRVAGPPVLGITFGPAIQLYYLIALYCFVHGGDVRLHAHAAGAHAQRGARQPRARGVHRLQHAARALPRVHRSGFFMGIPAGWRRSTSRSSPPRSSARRARRYLLFTFLGGAMFFFGPIIGAVLMVLALVLLSELTQAWLLYLGLIFLFMVMYAPGGLSSLIMMNLRVAAFGKLRRLLGRCYAGFGVLGLVMLAGAGAMIEMVYHLQLNEALGPQPALHGRAAWTPKMALPGRRQQLLLAAGVAGFEVVRRRFVLAWAARKTGRDRGGRGCERTQARAEGRAGH